MNMINLMHAIQTGARLKTQGEATIVFTDVIALSEGFIEAGGIIDIDGKISVPHGLHQYRGAAAVSSWLGISPTVATALVHNRGNIYPVLSTYVPILIVLHILNELYEKGEAEFIAQYKL